MKVVDVTYTVKPKRDWKLFQSSKYGQFEELIRENVGLFIVFLSCFKLSSYIPCQSITLLLSNLSEYYALL